MNLAAAANFRDPRARRLVRWAVWGAGSPEDARGPADVSDVRHAPGNANALSGADVAWARREGVLPLLASHASRGRVAAATGDVRCALTAERRTCLARNLFLSTRLESFLRALGDAGVPVLTIKGDALLRFVYPDAGARGMQDIDLLVPPAHWATALACAAKLGAKDVTPGAGAKDVTRRAFFQVALVFPWGGMVDLHRHLLPAPLFPIQAQGLLDRAIDIDGRRVPAGEDLFMHVALHAAKDGFLVKGRDLVDGLLLRESDRVSPALVEARAREWRARRATAVWLRALERFGPAPTAWADLPVRLDPHSRPADADRVLGAWTWEKDDRRALYAKLRLLAILDEPVRALRYAGTFGVHRLGDTVVRLLRR